MQQYGWIQRIEELLAAGGSTSMVYAGIGMNPCQEEVEAGLAAMADFQPDCVLAVGGGSAMDAAKAMVLFYEFPVLNFQNVLEHNLAGRIPAHRDTGLICIPSTSGTGSEVTRGTVITDTKRRLKVPIMTDCLRPDLAILDVDLTMSMPQSVAAETGMDALTHAMEAYVNHNLDDFDEALCRAAIEGIVRDLPESCLEQSLEARERIHNYQAMAGIGFANVGLGMVHGIAHAFGAVFHMAHGLTNAIVLPYALEFNSQNPQVKEKLDTLSYACHCTDIIAKVRELRSTLGIPKSYKEAGVSEQAFLADYEMLVGHAMLGATRVNPVEIEEATMRDLVKLVYYGE